VPYIAFDADIPPNEGLHPGDVIKIVVTSTSGERWVARGPIVAFESHREYREDYDVESGTTIITPARTITWTLSGECTART